MLQIIVIHGESSQRIDEIRNRETGISLAKFNEKDGCIDLSVLKSHIQKNILITHFIRHNECTSLSYEQVRTLTKVDTDKDGIMYMEFN